MKSKNSLVSIIITTKNSSRTIAACLDSIKHQFYKNIEIIVVDNNSADETKKISQKYTKKVFDFGPERSSQRNFGAKKAEGEFLLFLDSDMILTPKVIDKCLKTINKNPYLVAISIPEKSFGNSFWAKCKALERSFYIGVDWMEGARFFKKSIFEKLKGFDEKITGPEDFDLPQRIKMKYGENSIKRINAYIMHNEGNLSLYSTLKKKFYYAKTVPTYAKKGLNKEYYRKQASILERYKLFFSKPKKLFKNPHLSIGILFMKTCEFIAGGLGYSIGKFSNLFKNLIPLSLFLLLILIATRKFLFRDGYLLYGEYLDSKNYLFFLKDFLRAWSDFTTLGHSNIGFPLLYGLNPTFFITPAGFHVPWLILLSLLQLIFAGLTSRVYIILAIFVPFIGMFFFAKYWFAHLSKASWVINWAAFIAAVIYAVNPQNSDRMYAGHLHYIFGYGLFPFFLLTIFKSTETKNSQVSKVSILFAGLVFATLLWFMLHVLIISLIPITIYFLIFIFPDFKKIKKFIAILATVAFIGFLLNIHAWLPAIFYSEDYPFLNNILYNAGSLFYNSQFTTLKNVFTLTSVFELNLVGKSGEARLLLLKIILPLLALVGFILNKDRRKSLFVLIVALLGGAFATGVNYRFGDIYLFLYKNFFLFKALRDNSKFVILYAFGLSLLSSMLFIYLANLLRKKSLWLIAPFIIYIITVNPLFSSGNFGGAIVPFNYPTKYKKLKQFLKSKKEKFRVSLYPNEETISDYDWFPRTANGPIFFNVFNSFDPLEKSLANSNRTTSDLASRYLDYLESNLDKEWSTDRLGQEMVKYLVVDYSLPTYQKTLDQLRINPGVIEVEKIKGFSIFKIKNYNDKLINYRKAVYYYGDKTGLEYLPVNVALIDLGSNPLDVLLDNYSNSIVLHNSILQDIFLTSLKKYRFSFFPEVRFNIDGTSSFIVGGDNLREVAKKGVNFYNPEIILTVGPNSIEKKTTLKKDHYRIFINILNGEGQTNKLKFATDDYVTEKSVIRKNETTFQWIDFGELDIKNESPIITVKNEDSNTLILDSLVIIPSLEFDKLEKEFIAKIGNKKVYQLENQKITEALIKSDPIAIISQSYSPYWHVCSSKNFITNFYSLGTKCTIGENIKPKFIAEDIYIASLFLSAFFYLVIITITVSTYTKLKTS